MTQTEQVITALWAKGYVWAERQQRFTVYLHPTEETVLGLETLDNGRCLLWRLLTPRDDVDALIRVVGKPVLMPYSG